VLYGFFDIDWQVTKKPVDPPYFIALEEKDIGTNIFLMQKTHFQK